MILIVWGMIKDLTVFAVLLMIFFISFGVCASSLLYPNETDWIKSITGIVSIGYWKIYGELNIDEIVYSHTNVTQSVVISDPDNEACQTRGRCPDHHWIVTFFLMMYLLITNILLINLLIATFASTFERIRSESDTIWKFQRYELIKEYQDRPVLPPPFIILCHIWFFILYLKNRVVDFFKRKILNRYSHHGEDETSSLLYARRGKKKRMDDDFKGWDADVIIQKFRVSPNFCHKPASHFLSSLLLSLG